MSHSILIPSELLTNTPCIIVIVNPKQKASCKLYLLPYFCIFLGPNAILFGSIILRLNASKVILSASFCFAQATVWPVVPPSVPSVPRSQCLHDQVGLVPTPPPLATRRRGTWAGAWQTQGYRGQELGVCLQLAHRRQWRVTSSIFSMLKAPTTTFTLSDYFNTLFSVHNSVLTNITDS